MLTSAGFNVTVARAQCCQALPGAWALFPEASRKWAFLLRLSALSLVRTQQSSSVP